ncbi:MAG: hypothetical protein ABIE92_09475, partial [bacterium]
MRRKFAVIMLASLMASLALANNPMVKSIENETLYPADGSEEIDAPVAIPPYNLPAGDNVDRVGDVFLIGTTWYENQHNGTIGRMLALDSNGVVHFTWMNGTENSAGRHVYYNTIDLDGTQGWPEIGTPVESS